MAKPNCLDLPPMEKLDSFFSTIGKNRSLKLFTPKHFHHNGWQPRKKYAKSLKALKIRGFKLFSAIFLPQPIHVSGNRSYSSTWSDKVLLSITSAERPKGRYIKSGWPLLRLNRKDSAWARGAKKASTVVKATAVNTVHFI